jgi:hypothetical protein
MAELDQRYGGSLPGKIADAIDNCDFVIAILTVKGSRSASVNQEIGYAQKAGKLIFPLLEEGVDPSLFLQGLEFLRFGKENEDKLVDEVNDFVKGKVGDEEDEGGFDWRIVVLIIILIIIIVIAVIYGSKN